MVSLSRVSTGIKGLDRVLNYLQTGDNVVLQVDAIEDYRSFVLPLSKRPWTTTSGSSTCALPATHRCWRQARKVAVYKLNADTGFESFSTQVHNIIRQEGRDVFYVFDSLSDLLLAWATDLMIGNFFRDHLPVPVRAQHGRLFCHPAEPPLLQDHRPHPGNHPGAYGRLQLRGQDSASTP